jgi:hypothetical protein
MSDRQAGAKMKKIITRKTIFVSFRRWLTLFPFLVLLSGITEKWTEFFFFCCCPALGT